MALEASTIEPTVLDHVSPDSEMWHEETFGPVAAVRTFADEHEAIEIANDTPYGLAAYMYSRDVGRVFRVSEQLEYGVDDWVETRYLSLGGITE